MTHQMKGNTYVLVCLLTILFVTFSAHGKGHDVSIGMRLEEALSVVKRCIIETTAFRDPRARHQRYKELRAQDTLEYAGITDDSRLSILRRYIVRNSEFGVPHMWGVRFIDEEPRPYLIPNSALAGIKKSMKLEELAREITKVAGLPFMTYKKAAQVTANCRNHVTGSTDMPRLDKPIAADLKDQQGAFVLCMVGNKFGIESAGIIDGEGDFYPYSKEYIQADIHDIVANGTYDRLIRHLHKNAAVDLPEEFTAEMIARLSFLEGCSEISFPVSTWCQRGTGIAAAGRLFGSTPISEIRRFTKNAARATPSTAVKGFRRKSGAARLPVPDLSDLSLSRDMTLRQLTEEIKKKF